MTVELQKSFHPILTAEQMARIDTITITEIGIPGIVLMESAGREIARIAAAMLGRIVGKQIIVFCGKGNNGGDGFVVARYLANKGANVTVVLGVGPGSLPADARSNFEILQKIGINVQQSAGVENISVAAPVDLIVDAILGTGVKGTLQGPARKMVSLINRIDAPVVAIDLPTGINADTGQAYQPCVQADVTVTIGALKQGLLFSPGREQAGRLVVADIGFPPQAFQKVAARTFLIGHESLRRALPERKRDLYKNRSGQILVLAGSTGLSGAAYLCSQATLRSGAGLTVLGTPASLNPVMEQKLTEVMTLALAETSAGTISFEAKNAIKEKMKWADAVALGPGLSVNKETTKLVKWLTKQSVTPLVLDADALNCLSDGPEILLSAKAPLVLTPHPGELARLTGQKTGDLLSDPVSAARHFAQKFEVVVVLKGAPTVVSSPDGDVFINPTGNSGMATAGMGDVLTGVIASLLGQRMSPLNAAVAGVYIHGLAGDLVARSKGQAGLMASDVLEALPSVMAGTLEEVGTPIEFI